MSRSGKNMWNALNISGNITEYEEEKRKKKKKWASDKKIPLFLGMTSQTSQTVTYSLIIMDN